MKVSTGFAAAAFAAALASGSAVAVYLDVHGVGQALLFPYYTVRSESGNAFNTYISVANTSLEFVAVKVRFREGRNSRLVGELNVYMAPRDMWTAALVPDGAGTRLVTRDRTCTDPPIPAEGVTFTSTLYAGGDDHAGTGLDRTQEGHLEVIEMATLPRTLPILPSASSQDCSKVQGTPNLEPLSAPQGGLTGTATLINVNSGLDAGYVPDALAALTSAPFFTLPGQPGSDFDSPQVDGISHVAVGNKSYRLVWNRGVDAVSSVLMSQFFENEFVLDPETASKTDWVLTLPTRRLYVTNTTFAAPFSAPFLPRDGFLPCEGLSVDTADREGRFTSGSTDFPEPPPSATRLCWSSGVFRFASGTSQPPVAPSSVLGSMNTLGWTEAFAPIGIFTGTLPGGVVVQPTVANGRAQLRFDGLGVMQSLPATTSVDLATGATTTGSMRLLGYPAVGFMIRTFSNGTLSCGVGACQGNYASPFSHRRVTRVLNQ